MTDRNASQSRERNATGKFIECVSQYLIDEFGVPEATKTDAKKRPYVAKHSLRKFSNEQVVQMRERNATGETQQSLADEFGTTRQTINYIVTGQLYRDVSGPITKKYLRLTNENVISIRKRYAAGELLKDLAVEFDVSKSTISNIVREKAYKHLPNHQTSEKQRRPLR